MTRLDRVFCVGHFLSEIWIFHICYIVLDIIVLETLCWTYCVGHLASVALCWKILKRYFLLYRGLFSVGQFQFAAFSWTDKSDLFSVGLIAANQFGTFFIESNFFGT